MKIQVKAKPGAREERIELVSQQSFDLGSANSQMEVYKVSVKELPTSGRANEAITRALGKHLNIAPSKIHLVSGRTSRTKIFEII